MHSRDLTASRRFLWLAPTLRRFLSFLCQGTLGEEVAIESLKVGATDYVLKQRLSRLAPAVRRALSETAQRRERKEAEEALRRSEASLRRHREQLRELAAHLVSVQEAEQKRLARELHDGLNQQLAMVSVALEKLHLEIPAPGKASPEANPGTHGLGGQDLRRCSPDGISFAPSHSRKSRIARGARNRMPPFFPE